MKTDQVLQLQQPVVTRDAIRAVNFFNGRLLTGNDLSRQQQARRQADRHLGLALGDGVAFGLDVAEDSALSTAAAPVLRITAGLALNRLGQTLRLDTDTSVALSRRFDAALADRLFDQCNPIAGGSYVVGAGVYVLTIAPAELGEGRASSNGFDPAMVRCNTDATVEALQFRLLTIDPRHYADLDLGSPQLRNRLAYRCFGPGLQADWLADVFRSGPRGDGLLERLRPAPLGDADVPLALLFISGSADIQFIDTWSVRRPLPGTGTDGSAPVLADTGRIVLGRAMFHQFQDQVADWASTGDLGGITARGHCAFLPAVGIIPVPEEIDATDTAATRFFTGMTYRGPVFINAMHLEALCDAGFRYPPIDAQGEELVWLYRVRENRMIIDRAAGTGALPESYLVFASGQLPYAADARFDRSSFDYANYALGR